MKRMTAPLGPGALRRTDRIPQRTFTIVGGDVWASRIGDERPDERVGRLVAVCDSPEDADRAAAGIDTEWKAGTRKSTEFALRLRVAVAGTDTYRTSRDGEAEKILVVDPLPC